MKKILVSLLMLSFLAVPLLPASAYTVTEGPPSVGISSRTDAGNILGRVVDWVFLISISIGIIFLIIAGIFWMTAMGNAEKIGTARQMLIWGLVGIATAILAFSAQVFVESFLTA